MTLLNLQVINSGGIGTAWEQGYPNIGAVKDRKGVHLI